MNKALYALFVFVIIFLFYESALSDDTVLAKIGDTKIMQSDFDKTFNTIPKSQKSQYATLEGKRKLLDGMISNKVLAMEASRLKLDEDPLVQHGINMLVEQAMARLAIQHIKEGITIKEDDIKKYYEKNQEEFKQPEKVWASHILVNKKRDAKKILKKIKSGKDFSQLASENSTCISKDQGGDLGWFSRGKMAPAFEKAAFSLKKGETSGVVKSQFGYHIIKLKDRSEAGVMGFRKASKVIEKKIKSQRVKLERIRLKEKLKVKTFYDNLK